MGQPLQTRLRLLFTASKKDVTESILPDLLSFTFDDKETAEADEISITLKDIDGKWACNWKPNGGEVVRAYISTGTVAKKKREIFCGSFYVDSIRTSGSPRTFEMKAVSIPLNKPIRRKFKSRSWESQFLTEIAQTIANEAELKLVFDSNENPKYDRQDQYEESDLKFLSRLCEDAGLSIKVTNEKIVIFDQFRYESKTPVKTLTLGSSDILSWDFDIVQSETYKSCTINYRDPKKKKEGSAAGYNTNTENTTEKSSANAAVCSWTEYDPLYEENGQEYEMKKRAKSLDEAKRLAKAKLRKLNSRSVTGSITVIGDVMLRAGLVITCKGFGKVDGNFIIETSSHSVSTSGYTTALSLRRVNSSY